MRLLAIALTSVCLAVGCASSHEQCKCAVLDSAEIEATSNRASRLATLITSIDAAIDVAETNIANADTRGYRVQEMSVSADGPSQKWVGDEQGALEDTRRSLDVGIQGEGFFQVKLIPDGDAVAYSRCGNFFINHKGELVLGVGDGYQLEPPIALPTNATDVTIGTSGIVEFAQAGGSEKKQAGQIILVRFTGDEQLKPILHGLYLQTDASGEPVLSHPGEDGAGEVMQGFLEASNVNVHAEQARIRFLNEWRNSVLATLDVRGR